MNRDLKTVNFILKAAESKVYLVGQKEGQKGFTVEMRQTDGCWVAQVKLGQGVYRFRYYLGDGRNVIYLGPAHTTNSKEDGLDAVLVISRPKPVVSHRLPFLATAL